MVTAAAGTGRPAKRHSFFRAASPLLKDSMICAQTPLPQTAGQGDTSGVSWRVPGRCQEARVSASSVNFNDFPQETSRDKIRLSFSFTASRMMITRNSCALAHIASLAYGPSKPGTCGSGLLGQKRLARSRAPSRSQSFIRYRRTCQILAPQPRF